MCLVFGAQFTEQIEQINKVIYIKAQFLEIAAWKLLEREAPVNWLSVAAWLALHDFKNSIVIHKQTNELKLQLPHKVKVNILAYKTADAKGEIAGYEQQSYDLTKQSDLRRLLSLGSERISSIKTFREQLAQLLSFQKLMSHYPAFPPCANMG